MVAEAGEENILMRKACADNGQLRLAAYVIRGHCAGHKAVDKAEQDNRRRAVLKWDDSWFVGRSVSLRTEAVLRIQPA